jgi:hypothetical protein
MAEQIARDNAAHNGSGLVSKLERSKAAAGGQATAPGEDEKHLPGIRMR